MEFIILYSIFHFNEFPFRHLFEFYFWKTTALRTFGDEFGKKITQELTKLTIVDYSPISGCNIENNSLQVICELSNDQNYLYNMYCQSNRERSKMFSYIFVDLNPGTIHHARWLTRANRIFRLFAIEGNLQIPLVTSNTQAVVRTVKLITELFLQASSYEERHGRALVTLESRNTMPKSNTKEQFSIH